MKQTFRLILDYVNRLSNNRALQEYNHSFIGMVPGKKCHQVYKLFVLLNGTREKSKQVKNHSFFWVFPGKNPIRCMNDYYSFYWIVQEKKPLCVYKIYVRFISFFHQIKWFLKI